jgi:hypothetical protein
VTTGEIVATSGNSETLVATITDTIMTVVPRATGDSS